MESEPRMKSTTGLDTAVYVGLLAIIELIELISLYHFDQSLCRIELDTLKRL